MCLALVQLLLLLLLVQLADVCAHHELVDDLLHGVAQLVWTLVILLNVCVLRHQNLLLAVPDNRLFVNLFFHHQPASTQKHYYYA